MTRPTPIIAETLAALLLLFGAYMGAYYAMLKGSRMHLGIAAVPGGYVSGPARMDPDYRAQDELLETILWPANQLDRRIRPSYWDDE